MRRILIAHPLYDQFGGAEYVSAMIGLALSQRGFEVDLYTAHQDIDGLKRRFRELFAIDIGKVFGNIIVCCERERRILDGARFRKARKIVFYKRFFEGLRRYVGKYVVFETQSNIPSSVDVSYVHYPAIIDYRSSKLHKFVYDWAVGGLLKSAIGRPRVLLTNSSWSANLIRCVHGMDSLVVYPPINPDIDLSGDVEPFYSRKDIVFTVSRLIPEKNIESIIEIAFRLRGLKFVICGTTGGDVSRRYIDGLRRAIAEKDLVDKLYIYENCSRDDIKRFYRSAKVYLHPMYVEHFGIAVLEAMAFGTPVLVYADGGAYTDLVPGIEYGYSEAWQAAYSILFLINDDLLWSIRSRKVREKAKEFTFDKFRDRIVDIVERIR